MAVNAYDKLEYGEFKLPSLQELMIAPAYQREQHNLAEQSYLEQEALNADANSRLIPGIDDEAMAVINEQNNLISQSLQDLSKKGVSPNVRQQLIQAKRNYLQKVSPIQRAALEREQVANMVREARMKDPTLFAQDPYAVSIGKWMSDPNSRTPGMVSGTQITQRVSNAAKQFSTYINQNLPQLAKSGLPYQYFTAVMSGASLDDVMNAMVKDGASVQQASQMSNMLRTLADDVVTSSRAREYFGDNPDTIEQIIGYANEGLYSALGQKKFGNMTDEYGLRSALEEQTLRRQLAVQSLKNRGKASLGSQGYFQPQGRLSGASPEYAGLSSIKKNIDKYQSKGWTPKDVAIAAKTKGAFLDVLARDNALATEILRGSVSDSEIQRLPGFEAISQIISQAGGNPSEWRKYWNMARTNDISDLSNSPLNFSNVNSWSDMRSRIDDAINGTIKEYTSYNMGADKDFREGIISRVLDPAVSLAHSGKLTRDRTESVTMNSVNGKPALAQDLRAIRKAIKKDTGEATIRLSPYDKALIINYKGNDFFIKNAGINQNLQRMIDTYPELTEDEYVSEMNNLINQGKFDEAQQLEEYYKIGNPYLDPTTYHHLISWQNKGSEWDPNKKQ